MRQHGLRYLYLTFTIFFFITFLLCLLQCCRVFCFSEDLVNSADVVHLNGNMSVLLNMVSHLVSAHALCQARCIFLFIHSLFLVGSWINFFIFSVLAVWRCHLCFFFFFFDSASVCFFTWKVGFCYLWTALEDFSGSDSAFADWKRLATSARRDGRPQTENVRCIFCSLCGESPLELDSVDTEVCFLSGQYIGSCQRASQQTAADLMLIQPNIFGHSIHPPVIGYWCLSSALLRSLRFLISVWCVTWREGGGLRRNWFYELKMKRPFIYVSN